MSTFPLQKLELRALEQRNRLHGVITDAKIQIEITKEKLDVKRNLKKHMLSGVLVARVVGLSLGYSSSGMITKN